MGKAGDKAGGGPATGTARAVETTASRANLRATGAFVQPLCVVVCGLLWFGIIGVVLSLYLALVSLPRSRFLGALTDAFRIALFGGLDALVDSVRSRKEFDCKRSRTFSMYITEAICCGAGSTGVVLWVDGRAGGTSCRMGIKPSRTAPRRKANRSCCFSFVVVRPTWVEQTIATEWQCPTSMEMGLRFG